MDAQACCDTELKCAWDRGVLDTSKVNLFKELSWKKSNDMEQHLLSNDSNAPTLSAYTTEKVLLRCSDENSCGIAWFSQIIGMVRGAARMSSGIVFHLGLYSH